MSEIQIVRNLGDLSHLLSPNAADVISRDSILPVINEQYPNQEQNFIYSGVYGSEGLLDQLITTGTPRTEAQHRHFLQLVSKEPVNLGSVHGDLSALDEELQYSNPILINGIDPSKLGFQNRVLFAMMEATCSALPMKENSMENGVSYVLAYDGNMFSPRSTSSRESEQFKIRKGHSFRDALRAIFYFNGLYYEDKGFLTLTSED